MSELRFLMIEACIQIIIIIIRENWVRNVWMHKYFSSKLTKWNFFLFLMLPGFSYKKFVASSSVQTLSHLLESLADKSIGFVKICTYK